MQSTAHREQSLNYNKELSYSISMHNKYRVPFQERAMDLEQYVLEKLENNIQNRKTTPSSIHMLHDNGGLCCIKTSEMH